MDLNTVMYVVDQTAIVLIVVGFFAFVVLLAVKLNLKGDLWNRKGSTKKSRSWK
jgi:hypothetical protein